MVTKYKAVLIQGKGWHVIGGDEKIAVTAKSIAVAMCRQMNANAKRIKK